jgi:hypothetical protein
MTRAPFIIALGFAGILTFAVAPASAQNRSGGDSSSGGDSRSGAVSQRGGGGAREAAAPRGGVRYDPPVVRFFSAYYTFRPRFSVGFGLVIGYPVAYSNPFYSPGYYYPYAYAYPYPYPYRYAYPSPYPYAYRSPAPMYYQAPAGLDGPYPPQADNSVGVQPPTHTASAGAPAGLDPPNTGGLSFEIKPADAHVLVDGYDVGAVAQFTPTSRALGLPAGRHHIEIVADGYRTMSSDVDVRAGQVIPFQGQMER